MISTRVSKEKIFRDFKRFEGKLKTEQAEKKALKIVELENNILEINKGACNEAFNSIFFGAPPFIEFYDIFLQVSHSLVCLRNNVEMFFNQFNFIDHFLNFIKTFHPYII